MSPCISPIALPKSALMLLFYDAILSADALVIGRTELTLVKFTVTPVLSYRSILLRSYFNQFQPGGLK